MNNLYQHSINAPIDFWAAQAKLLHWQHFPNNILSQDTNNFYRWYADGTIDMTYNCIDKWVEADKGDRTAFIYDSPVTNTIQYITYKMLQTEVAQFAGALKGLGVVAGDTVVIYMPMLPQTAIAMLACARIGAIHSVVFGGFAPHELAIRIDDAQPKVIISASAGIEFDKIIPYKPLVDAAIAEATHKAAHHIIYNRANICNIDSLSNNELDFDTIKAAAMPTKGIAMPATAPLYILYTSGTTGKPKGIVRDIGGHAVALRLSMQQVYDTHEGDVFWAASDMGWVVGHSYIVYAPLLTGCTSIIYEGKPIRTPDAGAFWRVISAHKVKTFFTAPTAIRAIRKEDDAAIFLEKYDTTTLKYLFLAGERCDPATLHWAAEKLQIPVIDHWWQTESGSPMIANSMGIKALPIKAGSATVPVCGFDIRILDDNGKELDANKEGNVVIRLPLPPGCLPTLWRDDIRFKIAYLNRFDGYYLSGDGGYKDKDGYIFIMGRIDDVINVSGHRLSTGEMEEIVATHNSVAECAVIGMHDELRGERPIGFVVVKDNTDINTEEVETQLINLVRSQIGAIAYFKNIYIVKRLPKTRSGKILRKELRSIANQTDFIVPSTIDDPAILDEIKAVYLGFGK
jgi:propionyl-CoA synthetase